MCSFWTTVLVGMAGDALRFGDGLSWVWVTLGAVNCEFVARNSYVNQGHSILRIHTETNLTSFQMALSNECISENRLYKRVCTCSSFVVVVCRWWYIRPPGPPANGSKSIEWLAGLKLIWISSCICMYTQMLMLLPLEPVFPVAIQWCYIVRFLNCNNKPVLLCM